MTKQLKLVSSNPIAKSSPKRGRLCLVAINGKLIMNRFPSIKKSKTKPKPKKAIKAKSKSKTASFSPTKYKFRDFTLNSSWISSAGWSKRVLKITTNQQKIYYYSGVDVRLFEDFIEAPSPGRFFLEYIKDKFDEHDFSEPAMPA